MKKITTHSPQQTQRLAQQLSSQLKGGEVLALVGELGAGKTEFTKGLAKAFGVKQAITSPTFVLMKVYEGKRKKEKGKRTEDVRLVHIDCYRLQSPEELVDIGAAEYFGQKDTVVIIEWADRVKKILPRQVVWVKFKLGKKGNERMISVSDK